MSRRTRFLAALAAAAALAFALAWLLRSDEKRIDDAIDDAHAAFLAGRDDEFLSVFFPDVRYQAKGGLAEIRDDLARFRKSGLREVRIEKREIRVAEGQASARLEVAVFAGVEPVAQALVEIGLEKRDGRWRVAGCQWR